MNSTQPPTSVQSDSSHGQRQPQTDATLTADQNQTQFAANEPILEDARLPVSADPDQSGGLAGNKKKRLLIGLVVGLVIAVTSLVLFIVASSPEQTPEPTQNPSPSPDQQTDKHPYLERAEALQLELEAADPVKEVVPFPPVNVELRLDEAES